MISWFRKDVPAVGSVFFRGPLAPRPEELDGLQAHGVSARSSKLDARHHWRLELSHPRWGRSEAVCERDAHLPPRELVEWDPRLSREEKEAVSGYGSCVRVRVEPQAHDVLRDRKFLLHFLDAVMGSHGLFAMDHVAQACWSRSALRDELQHDASLDISSLFTLHLLHEGAERNLLVPRLRGAGEQLVDAHEHEDEQQPEQDRFVRLSQRSLFSL